MGRASAARAGKLADAARITGVRPLHPIFLFAVVFTAIFLLHAPLLRLPYFWDEAGYYVPAARDLLLTGSLVPHSTLSTGHPPLALGWLALWWKLSGFTPAVSRTAMLLVAAFALTGIFRLARSAASPQVAVAAVACTALYPVFFAQSAMAHVDLAAAALSLWGLDYYLRKRRLQAVAFFCLAVLAKETAIIFPVALGLWELAWRVLLRRGPRWDRFAPELPSRAATVAMSILPVAVLAAWYAYHFFRTGHVFGSPEFFQYNVLSTLHPLRIAIALVKRLWQITGYMNLFLLTAAALAAMVLPPQATVTREGEIELRPRIALRTQAAFAVVTAAYVGAHSLVGGAALARYMLPVLPLVIIVCVSTLWRRVRHWLIAVVIVCVGFVLALFVNPPYPFSPEDNLAYRDYVLLHKRAANLVAQRYPHSRVLTAWPATDELSRPYLGYSKVAVPVVAIDDFSPPQLLAAARDKSLYDVALVFSTKQVPAHNLYSAVPMWEEWETRYFGYHRDVAPEAAARMLGGRLVFADARGGQWVGLIEIEGAQDARLEMR